MPASRTKSKASGHNQPSRSPAACARRKFRIQFKPSTCTSVSRGIHSSSSSLFRVSAITNAKVADASYAESVVTRVVGGLPTSCCEKHSRRRGTASRRQKRPNGQMTNGQTAKRNIRRLRSRWPGLFLTETPPKVLYYALTRHRYSSAPLEQRLEWLREKMRCPHGLAIDTDDKWDALISAWVAMQAKEADRKNWPVDLGDQPGDVFEPVGAVHYWSPEKLPRAHTSLTPQEPPRRRPVHP